VKITEVIEVQSPPNQVWDLFQDVPELTHCLPGAELTEVLGDDKYAGKVGAKLGPMTATFEGEASVTADPTARTGQVSGKGVDKSGGSVGQVKVAYALEELESGGTRVTVDADVILSGAAAQFGRTGLIKEMSNRLIGEFVQCVEAKLAAETPEEKSEVAAGEVKGFSLFFSSLVSSISAFFKRLFGSGDSEKPD
jgi:carbon monoxide dehydrogenase subunit G